MARLSDEEARTRLSSLKGWEIEGAPASVRAAWRAPYVEWSTRPGARSSSAASGSPVARM